MSNTSLLSRPELSRDTVNLILSYCKSGDLLFISLVDKETSKIVQEKLATLKTMEKISTDISDDILKCLYMIIYRYERQTSYWIERVFIAHCKYGNLEHVKLIYLKSSNLESSRNKALIKACKYGNLQIAQWLESIDANLEDNQYELCDDACEYDQIEIFKWLDSKKLIPNYNKALEIACRCGSIKIVKYLVSKSVTVNESHMKNAIIYNHSNIVKLLLPLYEGNKDTLYYNACTHFNLDMVKLLYLPEHDHTNAFIAACQNNRLNTVKWLYAKSTDIDFRKLSVNPYNCDEELMDWLNINKIPYGTCFPLAK